MSQLVVAHSRAPQILTLLNEYGPLSVKGLEAIIRPRITKRRMQECLLRLYEKGLVIRRFEASPFSRQYYELSQSDRVRIDIHKLTGIHPDRLIQPYFRSQELLHNEECAYWSVYLKEAFPDADVVRDFRFKEHVEIMSHFLFDQDSLHLCPDIVLFFHETADLPRVAIAIEIELTRKSDQRLYQKFRKYIQTSRTDGVIYLCHRNSLIDAVRSVYGKHLTEKCVRVDQYRDHFLLLGDRTFDAKTLEPKLLNHQGQGVSLKSWVNILRSDNRYYRRKELFAKPA
jgi:DNA-binding HxlR family transcriptional regulator